MPDCAEGPHGNLAQLAHQQLDFKPAKANFRSDKNLESSNSLKKFPYRKRVKPDGSFFANLCPPLQQAFILRNELENLYRTHRQGLFSFALSLTGCRQQAEDAVHAAFAKLCGSMPDHIDDLKSYVFACVRNAALDGLRTDRRRSELQNSIFGNTVRDSTSSGATDLGNELNHSEQNERLKQAVEQLSSGAREVVVMKIYSGLTFEEIGRVLEQPAKTVATKYRRALIKLEQKLRGKL